MGVKKDGAKKDVEDKGGRRQNRKEGGKKRKKPSSSTQGLTEDLVRDTEAGTDILYKICNSTQWNWKSGSTLIFWGWPKGEQQTAACDGKKAWVQGPLPHFTQGACPPKQDKFELIVPKIKMALDKGYVTMFVDKELMTPWEGDMNSFIESLMEYFDIPKADDIRMVISS
jgi:hypothetical protein